MKTKLISLLYPFTIMGSLLVLLTGCPEEPNADPPTLTTAEVIGITSNWAISGGNITDDGGTDINERGVCWSTSDPPSISDQTSHSGAGTGEFTCTFKGLQGNTTYYLRAYATNSSETGYGSTQTFTTPPTVSDVDGNEYATVVIGTQTWTAENLIVTHYRNGDPITYIAEMESWGETEDGEYCDYDLIGKLPEVYGLFYDGYVVIDSRNIAPEGWHVPTDEEWTILIDFLGGEFAAAEKLRETGYTHWLKSFDGNPFPEGTNESGFTALPAGMAGDDHRGWEARFHTSSMVDEYAKKWVGPDCTNLILRASTGLDGGMPIRLIKD